MLPQIILGNERVLAKADARKINAEPVARVYCLRQKSGWVNKEILAKIIELMGIALKPWPETRFFACAWTRVLATAAPRSFEHATKPGYECSMWRRA